MHGLSGCTIYPARTTLRACATYPARTTLRACATYPARTTLRACATYPARTTLRACTTYPARTTLRACTTQARATPIPRPRPFRRGRPGSWCGAQRAASAPGSHHESIIFAHAYPRDVVPRAYPRDVFPRTYPRDVFPRAYPRDVFPRAYPRDAEREQAGYDRRDSRQFSPGSSLAPGPAACGIPLIPFVPPNPGESRIKIMFCRHPARRRPRPWREFRVNRRDRGRKNSRL